jgi:hypothetical protein
VEREDGEVERGGGFEGGAVSGEEGKCGVGGVCGVEEVGDKARGEIDLVRGYGVFRFGWKDIWM